MTDVVAITLGVAIVVVGVACTLACLYWQRADAGYHTALDAGAAATRAEVVAEKARDDEHTARVAAEAARESALDQLTATQAALAAAQEHWRSHVHDVVASGSTADALAAFEQLFARVPTAGATAVAAPGGHGAAAAAVPPAGPSGAGAPGPAPGPGR